MFRDDSGKNRKINSADGKSSSTDSSISEDPMLCIKLAPVLSFVSFFVVIAYLFFSGIIDAIVSIGLICLLLFLSKLMKFFKSKFKHGPETNVSTETSDNSSNSYREVIEKNSSEKNIPKRKSPTKPGVTENRKKSTINSFKPTIRKIEETKTEKLNMKSQITITIVFENDEYDQLTKKLSLNTTIGDIKKYIANEYDIKNEIVIKYKKNVSETVPIDSKKTVSEIQSKIRSKDSTGRFNYFLYAQINSPKTVPSKSSTPKKAIKASTPKKSPFLEDITDDDIDEPIKTAKIDLQKRKPSPRKYKPKLNYDLNSSTEKVELNEAHKKSRNDGTVERPKNKVKKYKYSYVVNRETDVYEIELEKEATVRKMKNEIAEIRNIENLANIKITFAGKDLTDDIVLYSLNVGNNELKVYIRSEEEILLLTAKALRV